MDPLNGYMERNSIILNIMRVGKKGEITETIMSKYLDIESNEMYNVKNGQCFKTEYNVLHKTGYNTTYIYKSIARDLSDKGIIRFQSDWTFKYHGYNNKEIKTNDDIKDVEFIEVVICHEFLNKDREIKNKKNKFKDIIAKRYEEIEKLKRERDIINEKLDTNNLSDEEIAELHDDIKYKTSLIRNHHKEIEELDYEIEIGTEVTEYNIKLYRDKIQFVNNLPDQNKTIALVWSITNEVYEPLEPTTLILRNKEKIKLLPRDILRS